MGKYVYSFSEGSREMTDVLGVKGANLADMTNIGLPVPFGFTVTTGACNRFYEEDLQIAGDIREEITEKLEDLENVTEKRFGDPSAPLLLSVRAGAPVTMPGMMDTMLNIGINDEITEALAKMTGSERFAYDTYCRFIKSYGTIVMGLPKSRFDLVQAAKRFNEGLEDDEEFTVDQLKSLAASYKNTVEQLSGESFPQDPEKQLMDAISAVFLSWNGERAVLYRKLNDIPDNMGTAVSVQSMVFGNMGEDSCTGVAFTRNPSTGENSIFGEILLKAQGAEMVAGLRTPDNISTMSDLFPECFETFVKIARLLEKQDKDMQNVEFTVEKNRLYILQARPGERTAQAAVRIAVEMVEEGLISKEEAVLRQDTSQMGQLLHRGFDPEKYKEAEVLATGLPASPGAASGRIYFTAAEAEEAAKNGYEVLLIRQETSLEDLAGMVAAEGILTAKGGTTSHAAMVARGIGKCCVAGCDSLDIDEEKRIVEIEGEVFEEGDFLSIDGSTGKILRGKIDTVSPELSDEFSMLMEWADDFRTIKIRANADNPREARQALAFGAEGIGLCRTEHMFFMEERIPVVRRMILAATDGERRRALAELMPFQKTDFKRIFETMGERPVTIRLLDPPLHEFLPQTADDIEEIAEQYGMTYEEFEDKVKNIREINPMLGRRGCRLAITHPEIIEMQVRAIVTAVIEVKREKKFDIMPEIMIPLISSDRELRLVKRYVTETARRVMEEEETEIEYRIGTMIEVPRACLTADKLAEEAEFFSFGTNDLTQMTYGFSRDDTGHLIQQYEGQGVLPADPFHSLDMDGVGRLIEIVAKNGRHTRSNLRLGMCGEQAGEPATIEFCHHVGMDYVSCSPFRIPMARIASAQAALRGEADL